METVVVIERKTFEEIMARFNRLVNRVEEIRRKSEAKRLGEWLDSAEVCRILQVSPRTLQTLRSNRHVGLFANRAQGVLPCGRMCNASSRRRGAPQTGGPEREKHLTPHRMIVPLNPS